MGVKKEGTVGKFNFRGTFENGNRGGSSSRSCAFLMMVFMWALASVSGCSAFTRVSLNGAAWDAQIPARPVAQYTVMKCTDIWVETEKDGEQGWEMVPVEQGTTIPRSRPVHLHLDETPQGLVLYETNTGLDGKTSTIAVTNRWVEGQEDHFLYYSMAGPGLVATIPLSTEIVLPADRKKAGTYRKYYPKGRNWGVWKELFIQVYEEGGVEKIRGVPTLICPAESVLRQP
jgi:hypothetical protein